MNINFRKFLTASLVMAIALVFTAGSQVSASGNPGSPTNVQVSAGDTEATITWTAPSSDGTCSPSDYQVWVEKVSDGEITKGDEVQSGWIATGLDLSTDYTVTVWTYSINCNDYSLEPATATFSTTAADEGNAVTPTEKHAPKRVKNLAVSVSGSTATVSWDAPGVKDGKHYAATDYMVKAINVDTKVEVATVEEVTGTSTSITDLSAGRYKFKVIAYNSTCDCWGKWRGKKATVN